MNERCLARDGPRFARRIAAVEPSEPARQQDAGEKNARPQCHNMFAGMQIKVSNGTCKAIANRQIEEAPKHVDRRRLESLAAQFGKRALKRTPHHAANKMRHAVGEKSAGNRRGYVASPS